MAETNFTWRTFVEMTEAWCATDPRIQQFGYGTITDIEVPRDSSTPDYPYFFMNPQSFQMATRVLNCTVNIIVMDLVPTNGFPNPGQTGPADLSEEGVWKAHSDMTEIIRDFIAYWNQVPANVRPEATIDRNVTIAPFVERFTDRVVGVTATLTVQLEYPLNNCTTPLPTTTTTTCPEITQWLEVDLTSCHNFKINLWDNVDQTDEGVALCTYEITGTAYGTLGTVYTGTRTMDVGIHQLNFNLNDFLLPNECVDSFTVDSINFVGCGCPVTVILPN